VKKITKIVNICLSYRTNKKCLVFYGPQCRMTVPRSITDFATAIYISILSAAAVICVKLSVTS